MGEKANRILEDWARKSRVVHLAIETLMGVSPRRKENVFDYWLALPEAERDEAVSKILILNNMGEDEYAYETLGGYMIHLMCKADERIDWTKETPNDVSRHKRSDETP